MAMGIKQLAKLANVSIGTIDRVLHKRGGVSKDTELKVLEIIKDTGYQKNMVASRLKLASKKKIRFAVLIPETKDAYSYWKLPKKGILKAVDELREFGVKVDFYHFSGLSGSFRASSAQIISKTYDAIVAVPFNEEECNALLEKAKAGNIPVVFLDTEIDLEEQAYFVRQDSRMAGMVAGRLLRGLVGAVGKYLIVHVLNGEGTQTNNRQRENGFRAFFDASDRSADITVLNHSLEHPLVISPEIKNWLNGSEAKGIFVTNSRAYIIPELLSTVGATNTFLVGFDLNERNVAYLKEGQINFLINQQPKFQGYVAIKSLFNYLTKQDSSELHQNIPIEIMVKEHFMESDSDTSAL